MNPMAQLTSTTEGPRGRRMDLLWGIPANRFVRTFTNVQGTGCGTLINMPAVRDRLPADLPDGRNMRVGFRIAA